MAAVLLASFPNSRIKPRPATTQSSTAILTIPSGIATLVAIANLNRTLLLIRNLNSTSNLFYGYTATVDGLVRPDGGMLIKPFDTAEIDDPGNVYIYQNSGSPIEISIDEGEG